MQRLERDREALQVRLAKLQSSAQKESNQIAETSHAVISELREIARTNDRFTRRVTFVVIFFAGVQAVGTVLALTGVSWIPRVWRYFFG